MRSLLLFLLLLLLSSKFITPLPLLNHPDSTLNYYSSTVTDNDCPSILNLRLRARQPCFDASISTSELLPSHSLYESSSVINPDSNILNAGPVKVEDPSTTAQAAGSSIIPGSGSVPVFPPFGTLKLADSGTEEAFCATNTYDVCCTGSVGPSLLGLYYSVGGCNKCVSSHCSSPFSHCSGQRMITRV